MVIGISVDEVLRNFLDRFSLIYQKYDYTNQEVDFINNPVKDPELLNYFTAFKDKDELNKFMYDECALEIFGHAGQLRDNLMNNINKFLIKLEETELDIKVRIVSREALNSIPATYFFLSKTGCRINDIKFVPRYEDKWDHADILFTASPKALENKPDGKIGVKVNCSYNEHVASDFEIDRIEDVLYIGNRTRELSGDLKKITSTELLNEKN